ncbi:MAG: BON domain-containing protein [Longimicrobiales bacterium]
MPRDYEDVDGLDSMDDEELRERIVEEFADYPELDMDLVEIEVERGQVKLTGRVGTEAELQEFEHIVTDVLGIPDVWNEIVVDGLVRATNPEAADEAAVQHALEQGATGGGEDRTTDTAEHLMIDTAAEQFGTDAVGEAIERGYSYEPPNHPIQEGTESRELH